MANMRGKWNILTALSTALCIAGGCQPTSGGKAADRTRGTGIQASEEDELSNLDLGGDWEQYESRLSTRNTTGGTGVEASRGPALSQEGGAAGPGFSIVLGTFAGEGHLQQANQYHQQASVLLPDMSSGLRVQSSLSGSMVVYGNYTGWKDPRAKKDVRTLQDLTINGRQVFPQAMIAELPAPRDPASIEEAELLSLRIRYPDIRVLYTLEIAMWGDFESGQWPERARRAEAEQYARSLRQRGVPAFYHHDSAREMSMVTVGVFDHRAIDGQTGLRSPQVERFLLDFPKRMVNGEPVIDLYDPNNPDKGGRTQQPRIVEVPKL
ncbi:MAG: hypothetical protein P8K80_01580 [Phycisphaerales bacterium]|nr:hypothetical protein [Phycisphaerales bacterium]